MPGKELEGWGGRSFFKDVEDVQLRDYNRASVIVEFIKSGAMASASRYLSYIKEEERAGVLEEIANRVNGGSDDKHNVPARHTM